MVAGNPGSKFPLAESRELLKYAAAVVCITIVYLGLAKLSLALASIHPSATPIWPPTGFALAALLLLGYRIAPAILVGAFIANAATAGSITTSLAIATGNTLEALIGAWLINRWSGGRNTFDTPSGVAKFALISLVPSTAISATIGVSALSLAGFANWSDFFSIWMTWWMGDVAGALVITPAIVLWAITPRQTLAGRELVQSGLVYASAIAVGIVAFSPLLEQTPARTPFAFLAILPLIWAALWRNPRDTATTALLLSGFAVWGTISNGGPFIRASLNESFLLLLTFMISVSVPSLALSAEVGVRKRHQEHMDFVMRELSHRSKNLLAVVQSMANQVGRQTDRFDDFLTGFSARLSAFAETHDLLVLGSWQGADLRQLIRIHLSPFHNSGESPVLLEGPDLRLTPKAAEQIGLALHELGTNAVKHGALSAPKGTVKLRWELAADADKQGHLRLVWQEVGGPRVERPQRLGFGDLVITKIVPESLQGKASVDFETDGVRWVLVVPSSVILVKT